MQRAECREQNRGQDQAKQSAGYVKRQSQPRRIHRQQNDRRKQCDRRDLEDSKDESEAEKRHRNAGERAKQRCAGNEPPHPVGAEGTCGLYRSTEEAGKDAHLPGEIRIMRPLINRQHDEEDVGEDRRGIHAERDGGDIGAARLLRQTMRLPRIEAIACEDRQRHCGQDSRNHQPGRKAAKRRQSGDQQQVGKSAEKQTEAAVEISSDEPPGLTRRHLSSSRHRRLSTSSSTVMTHFDLISAVTYSKTPRLHEEKGCSSRRPQTRLKC
jgi:hypothetical protein